ncbi:SPFH domain-containing protein [Nocardia sp. NPDC059229]|uniref:SPFH domain-containing protein n=1 Tax=Nocardia sp. NPDC059229 TaxID=3346778 RepID=UPI003682FD0F
MAAKSNSYLDQVVAQQAELEEDLQPAFMRRKYGATPPAPSAPSPSGALAKRAGRVGATREHTPQGPVEVRVTGFWRWQTVLVPPNAFVVHTRRGAAEPLHIGLGVSFRFNPATDSYLVVPGAIQTILINAYCICRELQGVLVQGYVQWIIDDFATAYRKLDFSDPQDPMRLVNVQLREQAEAAIKDKVSTMAVRDVLSDKQPIIEELTARLRTVAEGAGEAGARGGHGLGLSIVTVQIKEAVVSSNTLWENLQKPYRSEQNRVARLAELDAQEAVSTREAAAGRAGEERRIENERKLAELRARNDAARFDRESTERLRRTAREHDVDREVADLAQQTALHALRLERDKHAEQLENARLQQELSRLQLEAELALAQARTRAAHEAALLDLDRERAGIDNANARTDTTVHAQLIETLPAIVAGLPAPAELKSVQIGGDTTGLAGVVAQVSEIVAALRPIRGS